MERKKTDRSNLEKKRFIFLQIGLLVSLAISVIAFEWNTHARTDHDLSGMNVDDYYEDEIINTFRKELKQEIVPPDPEPLSFEIKDDSYDIDDESLNWDTEYKPFEKINFDLYDVPEESTKDEIFTIVEEMPTFKEGGLSEFANYVAQNLNYPTMAAEHGIQGKVYIQFVINEHGEVDDAKVIRGVDALLDKEALEAVNNSPAWKPGMQRGVPVKVRFIIPVTFRLTN